MREQALLVHAFCGVGEPTGRWRRSAERLWAAFAALGETRGLVAGTSADVPSDLRPGDEFTVLATCGVDRPGVYQAVLYQEHDVVGFMAVLSPEAAREWRELDEEWPRDATGDLGTVRIFLGVSDRPLDEPVGGRLAREDAPVGTPFRREDGIVLWELPEGRIPGRPPVRRLAMLTDDAHERDMYAWAWTTGERVTLQPLARYLLSAAKIRHATWVRNRSLWFREAGRRVDAATDRLVGMLDRSEHTASGLAELTEGQAELAGAVNSTAGLVAALRDLRKMRISAKIAADQMNATVTAGAPSRDTFLDRDQRIHCILDQQLGADIGYLEATLESAVQVGQAARAVITERLAEHSRRLTVLQTSLLGTLLMALAVVQALQYKVPLPRRLHAPLIAVLAGLAFALPLVAERLGHTNRLGGFERIAGTLAGGTLGWLGWSAISLRGGAPPSFAQSLAASVLAAGAGLLVIELAAYVFRTRGGRRTAVEGRRNDDEPDRCGRAA
ncbi:hypothetical protein GCM10029978_112760 [Actinoallomurus acanthiterrae]